MPQPKDKDWLNGYKNKTPIYVVHKRPTSKQQLILKEINPEYSMEGLMLKLNIQYFHHLIRRADLLEKTLMLERLRAGEVDDRG